MFVVFLSVGSSVIDQGLMMCGPRGAVCARRKEQRLHSKSPPPSLRASPHCVLL